MTKEQNTKNTETNKVKMSFFATNPYIEDNIVKPTEKKVQGQNFVAFGERNNYPSYIYGLYQETPHLQTCINTVRDFVAGNGTISHLPLWTDKKVTKIVDDIIFNYIIYGNVYINVLRNRMGEVCDLKVMDSRKIRNNDDNTIFFYSPDFDSKSYGRCKLTTHFAYDKNSKDPSSIYYFKNQKYSTYGLPIYNSAILAIETERQINKYNYNEIINGFASNVIINMNNGQPSDEQKEEIEESFQEKFTGADNAGRFVLSFNNDKDHATTIEKIETENIVDKYTSLQKRCMNQIFSAFRINANLVGISTENIGFSAEEYEQTFKIYNKTVIKPIQDNIVEMFEDIFGKPDVIEITPFEIKFE